METDAKEESWSPQKCMESVEILNLLVCNCVCQRFRMKIGATINNSNSLNQSETVKSADNPPFTLYNNFIGIVS